MSVIFAQEEQLDDVEENGTRRSSRTRRMIYDTYDQKVLEQSYEDQPLRKRYCREVQKEDSQDNDDVRKYL